MGLTTQHPEKARSERNVGNIYARLDEARRQREQILETPAPANDDRRASKGMKSVSRAFPRLKPPVSDMPVVATERRIDKMLPWLLGCLIFAVIFAFAVG